MLYKFVTLVLLTLLFSLESIEFVLFTQPKTATHLLIPILEVLTNKKCYWAPEFTNQGSLLAENFEKASQNPEYFLFSLRKAPWTKETMDQVWKTNKKKNTFLHLHAPYSPTIENYLIEKKCINFFVKRDPRDQIVSLFNHYKHINCNDKEIGLILTDEEKLLRMIRKESKLNTIHYMNWLNSPVCCSVDFEKLMGTHGGVYTQSDAIEELRKISRALGLELSDAKLKKVYQKCFGHGWSFFKGKVGVWKEYFHKMHRDAIKEEIGNLLIQLGYEKDLKW